MNWNKTTAIGTALLAAIGILVFVYNVRKEDLSRFELHEALEGHPRLVEQNRHTRELLENKISNLERMMKENSAKMDTLAADMKEMRACMHRIERGAKQ